MSATLRNGGPVGLTRPASTWEPEEDEESARWSGGDGGTSVVAPGPEARRPLVSPRALSLPHPVPPSPGSASSLGDGMGWGKMVAVCVFGTC